MFGGQREARRCVLYGRSAKGKATAVQGRTAAGDQTENPPKIAGDVFSVFSAFTLGRIITCISVLQQAIRGKTGPGRLKNGEAFQSFLFIFHCDWPTIF